MAWNAKTSCYFTRERSTKLEVVESENVEIKGLDDSDLQKYVLQRLSSDTDVSYETISRYELQSLTTQRFKSLTILRKLQFYQFNNLTMQSLTIQFGHCSKTKPRQWALCRLADEPLGLPKYFFLSKNNHWVCQNTFFFSK